MESLLASADVFLTNMRVKSLARMNLTRRRWRVAMPHW